MTTGNGRIPLIGHRPAMKKDSDLITVAECRALVAEECSKVHEHYLNQIPAHVARMIQDALLSYGLVTLTGEALSAAGPVAPLGDEGTGSVPASGDEMPGINPS